MVFLEEKDFWLDVYTILSAHYYGLSFTMIVRTVDPTGQAPLAGSTVRTISSTRTTRKWPERSVMTDTSTPATATIVSGFARITNTDIVGLSVATARQRYLQAASIPANARAQVNGAAANETYIVKAGDTLVFDQPTGRKG